MTDSAAYGDAEIRAELDKIEWYGVDPYKTKFCIELGKFMSPNKFQSAAAFADALVKATNEKYKDQP